MKLRFLSLCTAVFAIGLISAPASALLEERDLFAAGDGLITYDTDTKLEWLDLTETLGLSYNGADATVFVTALGFDHATTDQVTQLFLNAGGVLPFDAQFSAANFGSTAALVGLLGCTSGCGAFPFLQAGQGSALNPNDLTQAYLPFYQLNVTGSGRLSSPDGTASFDAAGDGSIGVYLVRPIPEPSAALLYGLGLMTVGWRLRRRSA